MTYLQNRCINNTYDRYTSALRFGSAIPFLVLTLYFKTKTGLGQMWTLQKVFQWRFSDVLKVNVFYFVVFVVVFKRPPEYWMAALLTIFFSFCLFLCNIIIKTNFAKQWDFSRFNSKKSRSSILPGAANFECQTHSIESDLRASHASTRSKAPFTRHKTFENKF